MYVPGSSWERFKDWVSANPKTKAGEWVRRRLSINPSKLHGKIHHFPAEERWTNDDREKLAAWIIEKNLTCPQCNTRLDEWDERKGGDRNAYYPDIYTDPGCEVIHKAYEAERENRKERGIDHMHGVKVRLVDKEQRQKEVRERRRKEQKEKGNLPEKRPIPFYPFHIPE